MAVPGQAARRPGPHVIFLRLGVVVVLLFAFVLARRLYLRWRAGLQGEQRTHPRVPASLLSPGEHTWLVFTTPYCATCGPVEERLRQAHPATPVVRIDATREPSLAQAFHVRRAPTVLLADGEGEVKARLVGPEAVEAYVRIPQ